MQYSVAPRTHTVNRPLCVSMLIADGDGEPSIVGSDEVDHVTCITLHVEG